MQKIPMTRISNNFLKEILLFNAYLYICGKEANPWLKIELIKEFFIYKVTVENPKNSSNDGPLTVSVVSRNKSSSVCTKKEHSPYLEYQCIPPVKGDVLYVNGPSFNTTLVLCYVTVFALGKSCNIFKFI